MQIVTSLLRLQASKSGKENDPFYKEAIDRVSAMALVHEQMYQSQSLSNLNLNQYIQDLSSNLMQSYSLDKQVRLNADCRHRDTNRDFQYRNIGFLRQHFIFKTSSLVVQIDNSEKQISKCPPCNIQILIFAFQNFFECKWPNRMRLDPGPQNCQWLCYF